MGVDITAMVTSTWGRRKGCVGLDFFAFVERWSCHGEVKEGRTHDTTSPRWLHLPGVEGRTVWGSTSSPVSNPGRTMADRKKGGTHGIEPNRHHLSCWARLHRLR
jgi:hypothetical protein